MAEETRILGFKAGSQEVSFKHRQEDLLGSKQVQMNCKTGEVAQKTDGLLFTTCREGSGSVDRISGEVDFQGEVSTSLAVRQEVKDAAGRGIEVGATQARKVNEAQLLCSSADAQQALRSAACQSASQGTAGVAGLVAGEVLGKVAGNRSAGAAIGEALAAGGTTLLCERGGEQLEKAVATAGTSLALSASQEVASGVMGAGCVASVAGRALGAYVTSNGSCPERLVQAAQAAGEATITQGAGTLLAQAGVPLCPTSVINEDGRKGLEFAGGSMVSVGQRDRVGSGQLADGTEVSRSCHEEGLQFRAGSGLGFCLRHAGILADVMLCFTVCQEYVGVRISGCLADRLKSWKLLQFGVSTVLQCLIASQSFRKLPKYMHFRRLHK